MRVLVVDDRTEILDFVADALRSRGLEAVTAKTVAEAEGVIDADDRPPVGIFDYVLGNDETGAELADRASANGMRVAVMIGSAVGVSKFDELPYPTLRKPFRLDDLYRTVEGLLRPAASLAD
jgi:DNA-binding NtrC family response regulator